MADIANFAAMLYERFTRNLKGSFEGMAPEKWIRLVIIVGTYMLLRPYLLKLGGKQQMKQHEKEAAEAEEEAAAKAKMSPNELRGHKIQIPEDSEDDDDNEGEEGGEGRDGEDKARSSATEWGKKARKRQRTMIKKILEAEEKRLQELQDDDEDKDIQEFLTD